MKILIVGTAGRDFHVFHTLFRDDPDHRVVAFTSADLASGRSGRYPACLAGPNYPDGVPILPEDDLERIVAEHGITHVVFAYSEIGCAGVSSLAARVLAAGADFTLVNPRRSMLASARPVIAVTSASPGAGKSPTVRYLAELLSGWNLRVAVIRHPLRDQDFAEDRAHAFTAADGATTRDACAEPQREPDDAVPNVTVFSGLDFGAILRAAEAEADVVVWDGAGSDLPFLRPSLHILLTDPLRADEEADQFPGEVGLRMADVVVVSKCDSASGDQVATIERAVAQVNPDAVLLTADSPVLVENGAAVTGLTVVVVEEELTLSLGALKPGAGSEAAHMVGASGIISPLPQASGRLAELYARHPEAQSVLPVTGYDARDLAEVKATLEATPSEAVIDATRVDLAALLGLARPVAKAGYTIRPHDPERLAELVRAAIGL